MKKIYFLTLFTTMFSYAQIINIPDANFKSLLLQADTSNVIGGFVKIDANDDGEIEQNEALLVYEIILPSGSNIINLIGIEYFTNLMDFSCIGNNITSANLLSTLTQLTNVDLRSNQLNNLNLAGLINLENLAVDDNQLTDINLTGLPHLRYLRCGSNQLTNIDFSNLPALKAAICGPNLVTVLDFSNNPLFDDLGCTNSPNLTTIIIKNNKQHLFTGGIFNGCWNNNPNLSTICVDDFEVSGLQTFLANCVITQPITIVTDCALSNETFTLTDFSIAPNPTKGSMFFDNSKTNFTSASVYNYLGQEIMVKKLNPSSNEEINLTQFAQGAYVLNVTDGVLSIRKAILKN